MTQDDYRLWTGEAVTFEDEDWCRTFKVAASRLASFLCLDALPTPLPDDLAELLANLISGVRKRQGGNAQVESKSVRNFTIRFRSEDAVNAFAQIATQYGDVIAKYSNCGSSIDVEKTTRSCCRGCF